MTTIHSKINGGRDYRLQRLEMNNKSKQTSQELINLIYKLVVKPLLRIPAKQTFTLSHKSGTWLVSLTIISTHKTRT